MFYEFAFLYTIVGSFVAGAIAREKVVKNALAIPITVFAWPIYLVIFSINQVIGEYPKAGE